MPGPVLEWRQAAREDLLAIVDYIADDNPAAAQALKDEIETKVARLPNHPKRDRAGRVVGTREVTRAQRLCGVTERFVQNCTLSRLGQERGANIA